LKGKRELETISLLEAKGGRPAGSMKCHIFLGTFSLDHICKMGKTALPTGVFHVAKDHVMQEKYMTLFISYLHPSLL